MKHDNCLKVCQLQKKFGQVTVLQDITYTFVPNRTYALMGASGSGKTTLIQLLAGFDQPTAGSIAINGQPVAQITPQVRAKTFGFVFQRPLLLKELTVLENILLAGQLTELSEIDCFDQAVTLLDQVGLGHTAQWNVGQLSGGQQQRVALARALINRPTFLIADELTGNLDRKTSLDIVHLLLKLQKEWKMGIIMSTHNQETAAMMELVFLIKDGTLSFQETNWNRVPTVKGTGHEPSNRE